MTTRTRRPACEARAQILDAALDTFLRHGYQSATLEQVARHVGITRPAVLYHFASKEELLRALVVPMFDHVEAILAGYPTDGDHSPTRQRQILADLVDALLHYRRNCALVSRFTTETTVLGIGVQAVRIKSNMAALLIGRDAFTHDPVARVRVATCLEALTAVMGARIAVDLDSNIEQQALIDSLCAILAA